MARITTDDNIEFTTIDAAVRYIKNLDGRVSFTVKVEAFLPTEEGRGFPGMTFLRVSRTQFIQAVRGMGKVLVDDRGGKIVLRRTAPNREGGLAFVSFY